MSSFNSFPDDISEFMPSLHGSNGDSAALRESVLAQTTGVLRSRRRMKRLGLAAALIGCYLAGAATVTLFRHGNLPEPATIAASTESTPLAPGSPGGSPLVHRPIRPEDDGVLPESASKPAQIAAAILSPYDRLRQIGDKQLEEQNDIAAAAHTYRRALQVASSDQRSISVDHDSWLLMAMKNDQSQTLAENMP